MPDNPENKVKKNAPYRIIVEHEYVGDKNAAEAFLAVLSDDIRRRIIAEARTFDNTDKSA